MAKVALITGITGQDGSYLAELLLEKGYEVHGIVRRVALEAPDQRMARLAGVLNRIHIHAGSLESYPSLHRIIESVKPDELYHLAAQSFVSYSFEDEFSTMKSNIDGTHHVLSSAKDRAPECRIYFAGSSEMFGKVHESPQRETTVFHPRSAYGISKVAGFFLTQNYREAYGTFACSGILFNHESPRRGHEFVTRKITRQLARIKAGMAKELRLGNLDARRDWGHAKDYVRAMHLMLQQDTPDDYVIASGSTRSVREFARHAFEIVGLNYEDYVVEDPQLYRPAEVELLQGDATKARQKLGWAPEYSFDQLVEQMVEEDLGLIAH